MGFQGEAIFEGEEAEKFIAALEKKFGTIREGSKELGGIIAANVFRDIMAHFDQEQGPDGQWQGWSRTYAEHMDLIGRGGNKILQDSGRLRQSFTPGSYRAADGGIVFFNNAKTDDGFSYAGAHNEGGKRLPQREFMWLSEIAMEEIADQSLNWLLGE